MQRNNSNKYIVSIQKNRIEIRASLDFSIHYMKCLCTFRYYVLIYSQSKYHKVLEQKYYVDVFCVYIHIQYENAITVRALVK